MLLGLRGILEHLAKQRPVLEQPLHDLKQEAAQAKAARLSYVLLAFLHAAAKLGIGFGKRSHQVTGSILVGTEHKVGLEPMSLQLQAAPWVSDFGMQEVVRELTVATNTEPTSVTMPLLRCRSSCSYSSPIAGHDINELHACVLLRTVGSYDVA